MAESLLKEVAEDVIKTKMSVETEIKSENVTSDDVTLDTEIKVEQTTTIEQKTVELKTKDDESEEIAKIEEFKEEIQMQITEKIKEEDDNDGKEITEKETILPSTEKKQAKKRTKAAKSKNKDKTSDVDNDGEPVEKKPKATIDISKFLSDNNSSLVLASDISELVKTEPCLLGIDEAGRGPVLGPMVYGTCFCPIKRKDEMAALGFADSKALKEEERDDLLVKILENPDMLNWAVHILSPNAISNAMLRRSKYNLNSMSHDTAIGLIQHALDGGANIQEVYVDTVGPPDVYQKKLKALFPQLDITVSKKADSIYPIVSAASICAKVVRDQVMAQWICAEGVKIPETGYGSGYPGDEKTKKFLHACLDPVFGFPQLVRFSWSTASKIVEDKCILMEWEDDEDEENENAKGMAKLDSYFNSSDAPKRHAFFEERRLYSVSGF